MATVFSTSLTSSVCHSRCSINTQKWSLLKTSQGRCLIWSPAGGGSDQSQFPGVNRGLCGSGTAMSLQVRFALLHATFCQVPHDASAIPSRGAEALLNHLWCAWSAQAKSGEKSRTTSALTSLSLTGHPITSTTSHAKTLQQFWFN